MPIIVVHICLRRCCCCLFFVIFKADIPIQAVCLFVFKAKFLFNLSIRWTAVYVFRLSAQFLHTYIICDTTDVHHEHIAQTTNTLAQHTYIGRWFFVCVCADKIIINNICILVAIITIISSTAS